MKIGIFLPNATFDLPGSPEVGGIETFSFTVGEALQKLGHDVVLFGGAPKAGRTHRTTTLTLELHPYWETRSIPDLGTRFQRLVQRLHFAWSIRQAWKKHRCDLVLLAKPFDWPVVWWWKKSRPDLRVIMGFHGTDFFAGDRRFYHAVDAAFAVSPRVADLAEEHVGVRPALIPNPVDVDFFSPGATLATPIKTLGDPWRLVSSGRLVGWKGFANLIEAIAQLRDKHGIVATLDLAGEGPERAALESQIARLQLGGVVKLRGLLDAPALCDLLRQSELYVLPSIGLEAFSISALEAACVGLPLLLSDQVGLAQFLDPADYASYPAREVDALVSRFLDLHAHRGADDRAARHARIRAKFSAERTARQILGLVENGASSSRRLLYLYPEEWTGRRAREVHTLSTCVALARSGWRVTLLTAGGLEDLRAHAQEVVGGAEMQGLELAALSRSIGPIRSAGIFGFHFRRWLRCRAPFDKAFTIHLKGAGMLQRANVPYLFEAHEIFAETPRGSENAQRALEESEQAALSGAAWRVATSEALAEALRKRYSLRNDFTIVPNAGEPPLVKSVAKADGPVVYCGSIADWKGLELAIEGARLAGIPLRVVGGTEAEWRALGQHCEVRAVEWKARVPLADIPQALAGARAGLIPTRPETGSGRYSCPMKLFDYARCGLPVVSSALSALQSLHLGTWCALVKQPDAESWAEALRAIRFDSGQSDAARRWAADHTWDERARCLGVVLTSPTIITITART
jgi:glycosyltransferase involved in cell wall biosynthesis